LKLWSLFFGAHLKARNLFPSIPGHSANGIELHPVVSIKLGSVASIASAPSPIDRSDFHGSIMLKDMTSDRMTIMIDCSEPITGVRIVNQTGQIMNELAIPETANTFAASLPIGRNSIIPQQSHKVQC
jgi:hypothetical protein